GEEQNLASALNLCRALWMKWDDFFSTIQGEIEKRNGSFIDEGEESEVGSLGGLETPMASMKLADSPAGGVVVSGKTATVTSSLGGLKSRLENFLTTPHLAATSLFDSQLSLTQGHQQGVRRKIKELLQSYTDERTLTDELLKYLKSERDNLLEKVEKKWKNIAGAVKEGKEIPRDSHYSQAKQLYAQGRFPEAIQHYHRAIAVADQAVQIWSETEIFYIKLRDAVGGKVRRLGSKIKERLKKNVRDWQLKLDNIINIERIRQKITWVNEQRMQALTQERSVDQEERNEIGETWNSIARKYEAMQRQLTSAGEAYLQGNDVAAREFEIKSVVLGDRINAESEHLNFLTREMETWKQDYQTEESRYLEKQEEEQSDGTKIVSLIYKRRFVGPLLRIERKVDPDGTLLSETKMAAEYLMVQLNQGESPASLLKKLREDFPNKKLSIEVVSPRSLLYRLSFQSSSNDPQARLNLFTQIKRAIEENNLAADCYPSTLLELASSRANAVPQASPTLPEPWHFNSTVGINPPGNLFDPAIPVIGDPIRVAVLDTGVRDSHQAFVTNIVRREDDAGEISYGYNACALTSGQKGLPQDKSGHGTHVAGIIAGAPSDVTVVKVKKKDPTKPNDPKAFIIENKNIDQATIRGVASRPGMVELLICKFFEPGQTSGFTDRALECIRYARENGARIINCSWGGSRDDNGEFSQKKIESIRAELSNDPCYEIFTRNQVGDEVSYEPPLFAPPIVAVMAAGNLRENQAQKKRNKDKYSTYPASLALPNAIAVAATGQDGRIAGLSYYGKKS
ncbi:MAG: S8 family serine peptidase, partial [Verrucomicrobiota bacterium]